METKYIYSGSDWGTIDTEARTWAEWRDMMNEDFTRWFYEDVEIYTAQNFIYYFNEYCEETMKKNLTEEK